MYLYVPQNNTGTFSKFSVSGATLTYVSTVSFTSWSVIQGASPYCDGTNVYYGLSKWAVGGGSVAATYGGASSPQGCVFGLNSTPLGYAHMNQFVVSTTVYTQVFVQSVPKF